MKNCFFFFVLVLIISNFEIYAQVAGVSNSKVVVLCPAVVGENDLEFEPAFLYSTSNQRWNKESKLIDYEDNKVLNSTELGFRLTYGAIRNLEIGAFLPSDASGVSLGAKYRFIAGNKFESSIIAGTNLNTEESELIDKDEKGTNQTEIGFGGILRYYFAENFSWDLDAQYTNAIIRKSDNQNGNLFINSELGYYIDKYQFCAGFSYKNLMNSSEELKQELTTLVLGGTIETGDNFVLIWGFPIDLIGTNIEKTIGLTIAFTMTIR